ncbi:MAG: acyl-CoA dehydrogenase [Chitinophagaceae bacterium]|nr:acyl-CoA dehydrogenase [Oligoflexus sp.]
MILLNPKKYAASLANKDPATQKLLEKIIAFFEEKGLKKIKEDDQSSVWYQDFLDFVRKEKIFATFLTPSGYGKSDSRWDMSRIEQLNEILGFYGLSYWYTWQVSILGLGPIWMSKNEGEKNRAAKALEDGGLFAFGLSEKAHGADLYSSSMKLTPQGDGFVANGSKYYIGNGNKAAMVSIFAKNAATDEYVWFTADPKHPAYAHHKISTSGVRQAYVAGIDIKDYPVKKEQILSQGPEAWDAALNTINVGKYQLGWASIGICTHALYEAMNHAANRTLYGKQVTDFPHVQVLFTEAYTRLVAMKLYALRACDYFRVASENDRRYLLYNPIQKMKVTMEGETVVEQLHQIIAAKGFEQDTYFEMAIRDIRMLPKLEGTVHVNVALVTKFMKNYLFSPKDFPEIGKQDQLTNDSFLFDQGPTKGLSQVAFPDYNRSFAGHTGPNITIFKEQIEAFKAFLAKGTPTEVQSKNMDYTLQLGELFTMIPFAQLIAENKSIYNIDEGLFDEIFKNFVTDFSKYAVRFYTGQDNDENQQKLIMKMVRKPHLDANQFKKVWDTFVYPIKGQY